MKTKTLLRLYLTMSLLEEPLFWGPILLIAMAKLGNMSTEQIFLSEALATGLILVLDAPSGMLADMIGRKTCVIVGKLCLLGCTFFLAFMDSPIHGYVANVLWAIGVSLRSGAESALIYDELQKRDALDEYQTLMRKTHSYWFFLTAFTTLATGFIAEIDLRLPLLLSLPGVIISSILILFFPAEEKRTHEHTLANYKKHMVEAMQEVWSNKRLKSLLLWLALLGVMGKIYFFTYNPYLELVHMPYSHVGIIFSTINILAFIASRYAFQIQEKLKCVGFGIGFCLQGVVMLIQGVFTHYLSGWLFGIQGLTRGYINTVSEPLLNKEIESERRATVLSFQSSLSSLLQVIGFLITSPLSGDITMLLTLLGVVALALGFLSRKV
jgi:MFS family permease